MTVSSAPPPDDKQPCSDLMQHQVHGGVRSNSNHFVSQDHQPQSGQEQEEFEASHGLEEPGVEVGENGALGCSPGGFGETDLDVGEGGGERHAVGE